MLTGLTAGALFGCAILTTGASYSTCAAMTDCTLCVYTFDASTSAYCQWRDLGWSGNCYTADEIGSNGWTGIQNSAGCPSTTTTTTPTTTKSVEPLERGGPCAVNYGCSSCVLSSWHAYASGYVYVDCVWDSVDYKCVMSNDTLLMPSYTVEYSSDCSSTYIYGTVTSTALSGVAIFFIVFGGCICCCGLVVVVLCSQKKRRPMAPPANGGAPYTQMNDVSAQPAQPQTVVIQQPFPQQYNQVPPPQYTSIAQPQQQYQIMPQHQVQHIPQQNAAPYEAAQVPSAPYNPGYTQQ